MALIEKQMVNNITGGVSMSEYICLECGNHIINKPIKVRTKCFCSNECKSLYGKKHSPLSLEYWLNKGLTTDEAKNKISSIQKSRSPLSLEYWLNKGLTTDEAKNKIHEIQMKRGLKWLEKHKNDAFDNSKNPMCIEYWLIKTDNNQDAENMRLDFIKKMNTREHYIEKYGTEGEKRFNEYKSKQRGNFSIETYIKRYGEEEGVKKWQKIFSYSNNVSKKSLKLFEIIYDKVKDKINTKIYCKNNILNEEFGKNINGQYVFYDFVIPDLKIAFEFNGDYWHCNPSKYEETYYHKQRKQYAKDIWTYDNMKKSYLIKEGFEYITIWESDFDKNIDFVINMMYNKIMNKWSEYERIKNC